jgi:teichuronic acid biosynthesis glycosyltransferase TuaH
MKKTISRTNNTIIITSMASNWDNDISTVPFSFAKELAKTNRVFYFDYPITIKDLMLNYRNEKMKSRKNALLFGKNKYKTIEGYSDNLIAVTPRVTLSINWIPKGKLYRYLLAFNNRIIKSTLNRLLEDFQINEYILFNSYNPFYYNAIPKDKRPVLNIYQSIDDISQVEYGSKHGIPLELEALRNADINFATSSTLAKLLEEKSRRVVHYLPNAADTGIFRKAAKTSLNKPAELKDIHGKIIMYVGNICQRINYDLLHEVAKAHSDKTLVLVGPRNDHKYNSKYDFDALGNLIFTGPKNIHNLPEYLQYADCAIIPFVKSQLTASIYPLKINEYLAAGKPVVLTDFSESVKEFSGVTYVAPDNAAFVKAIDMAIAEDAEDKKEARMKFAENNTWFARVNTFWQKIEEFQ